ncbi:MAG: DUF5683 domain-containing protein [Chitinispirillales bacterium]|jgi:TM2 domain-containing membrane protein YozV|nr:DUF5683 domain-containing protein [Chitinispirillales bacterium]
MKKSIFGNTGVSRLYFGWFFVLCLITFSAHSQTEPQSAQSEQVSLDLELAPLSVSIPSPSYAGLALSLVLPGGGQFYHGKPVLGGMFLAFEVSAGSFSAYWWDEYNRRKNLTGQYKDSAAVIKGSAKGDSALMYRSGNYSVWADREAFETRQAKMTAYNSLAWMVGGHVFGVMHTLGASGIVTSSTEQRSPLRAGWLAAAPGLGLGQLYNGNSGKGGMLGAVQVSLLVSAYNQHRLLNDASFRYNQMRDSTSSRYAYRAEHLSYWKGRYDNAFSTRNTYLWFALFTYIYSIFDAVVDAHLSDYPQKINIEPDLAAGPNEAALRFSFRL